MSDIHASARRAAHDPGQAVAGTSREGGYDFDKAAAAILSSPFTIRRRERAEGGFKPLTVPISCYRLRVDRSDRIEYLPVAVRERPSPLVHSYGERCLPEWFRTFVGLE